GDGERDAELKAAILVRIERDLGIDPNVPSVQLPPPCHRAQRALEAGGVADGEELLGVGPPSFSAGFDRGAEVDLQHPVRRTAVTMSPAAGDVRLRGIEGGA